MEVADRDFRLGLQYISSAVGCRAEGSARSLQALTDYADTQAERGARLMIFGGNDPERVSALRVSTDARRGGGGEQRA
jgi:hypothetical protein